MVGILYRETALCGCLLFFVSAAFSQSDQIDFKSLSTQKIWLNQLQYRKTLFGSWKSEADGEAFFLSKEGPLSPEKELRATYEMFQRAPETPWGYTQQPVICAFPTRRKFLEDQLKIKFTNIPCPEREEWKKPFLGSQLYLIFSDAYPNNPASMFGHTFLLFSHHNPPDSALGLMDYAINFSAETSQQDETSFLYSLKGVFGGYQARYRIYTFYQTVNQYIHWDSRDLWYLKVPFNAQQIDRFMDHIWEIFTTSHFDYYFGTENCSYRLLAAFDYADPDLDLIEEFYSRSPIYYVAPVSTYKAVQKRFGISEEYYSPSIQKMMKSQIKALSSDERKKFDFLKDHMDEVQKENNIKVLDALIAFFDYRKKIGASTYLPESVTRGLDQALHRRAHIPEASQPAPPVTRPPSPLTSHERKSLWLGGGKIFGKTGAEVGGMIAYHDLLSPSEGLERWSHVNVLETIFHKTEDETRLKLLNIADIMSFFPVESYDMKYSWRARGGFDDDYKTYLQGGVGMSWQTPREKELLYFFFGPTLSTQIELTDRKGVFFEAELGFVAEIFYRMKAWLIYRDILNSPGWNFDQDLETYQIRVSQPIGSNDEIRISTLKNRQGELFTLGWRRNF